MTISNRVTQNGSKKKQQEIIKRLCEVEGKRKNAIRFGKVIDFYMDECDAMFSEWKNVCE